MALNRTQTIKLLVLAAACIAVVAWLSISFKNGYQGKYKTGEGYRSILVNDTESQTLQSVKDYQVKVSQTLKQVPPIMRLPSQTPEQSLALEIFSDQGRIASITNDERGEPYRIQLMQSFVLPEGQATGKLKDCLRSKCYRLEFYNFTLNQSIISIVELKNRALLDVYATETQPELPDHMAQIAKEIASNHSKVKDALAGENIDPVMESTKTSLQDTVCERSNHLCVAPTFVVKGGTEAVWTIVDLTDLKLVGMAWTKWGDQPEPITERQLQTQAVEQELCGKVVKAHQGDWQFEYTLTGSDGLEIRDVKHKDNVVLASAKNVDWHVSYSESAGFGYSDAVGCPTFSTAAVVPSRLPTVTTEESGQVVLSVDFVGESWPMPCNYFYRQQFQMNNDGSIRIVAANVGRGCGDDGTYRPVTRIELPGSASEISRRDMKIDKEVHWQPLPCKRGTGCMTLSYQVNGLKYEVYPANGQFNDGGQGDQPYLYLTAVDENRQEGQQDLLTIGPCCNTDHHQGPEKFVNEEPINGKKIALWYVAQLKNNGQPGQEYCWATSRLIDGAYTELEYPCYSGPLIKPVKQNV